MKRPLLILGIGDVARLAHFYFTTDSGYRVEAFFVDEAFLPIERQLFGLPILSTKEALSKYGPESCEIFVAMGYSKMNSLREQKYNELKERGYSLASYISSKCTFLSEIKPGDNCFILEDNTIQPFVKIGSNNILWSGNHIGHDAVIGDHCFITSHVVVSGHTKIGNNTFIGVNATLRNSITIAPKTLIGAGAIIMKDTNPKEVYLPKRAELFSKTSDEIEL